MTGNLDAPQEVVANPRMLVVPNDEDDEDDDDPNDLINPTDNDGTDSDGIDTPTPTDNDGTDSDGIDTPTPTDNDGTDSDGIDTPTPTDYDGPDSGGIDTPIPTDNGIGYSGEPQKIVPIPRLLTIKSAGTPDAGPSLVSQAPQESTTLALNNDPTPIFDAEAGYRILTSYGNATEINLSDFLSAGTTGVTFALKSCDAWRADYFRSAIVESGKLVLASNDLGHVHGPNTQSETVCTVTGTGESGSEDREFRLYTVSDRTPPALAMGVLSLEEARETELDVRVNISGAFSGYLRLGWKKSGGGGRPIFGIVSGVSDGTVLTISGLEAGTDYDVHAYVTSAQGYDLYRAGASGSNGEIIAEGSPDSKWIRNLAGGGLGKSQAVSLTTAPEPTPTPTPIPTPKPTATPTSRPTPDDDDDYDSDGIDTPTPTDNDGTDSDGIDTTGPLTTDNDGTDSDGIDTPTPTDNDGTDSDGIDTTGLLATDNDGTDSDGIDTTGLLATDNDGTDSDGIDTTGLLATDNDGTDSDGIDTLTPPTPDSGDDSDDDSDENSS